MGLIIIKDFSLIVRYVPMGPMGLLISRGYCPIVEELAGEYSENIFDVDWKALKMRMTTSPALPLR